MRGEKQIGGEGVTGAEWITPACAGKSHILIITGTNFRDHPRMRGEKIRFAARIVRRAGSPPHARGKDSRDGGNVK